MSLPINFRPLGHHTLKPVTIERTPDLIKNFRAFLGASRLAAAVAAYEERTETGHDIEVIRLHENQPLIDGFVAYDKATFQGRRKLKKLSPEIATLANIPAMAGFIAPTIDEANRRQHVERLLSLDGQLKPLLLEWKSAATIARNKGAQLYWIASGAKSAPEFIAKVDDIEFEVECKRPTAMTTQRLGKREGDDLAHAIVRAVKDLGLHGRMTLAVPETAITEKGQLRAEVAPQLIVHLKSGPIDVKLPIGVHLSGVLGPKANKGVPRDLWLADIRKFQERFPNARAYAAADHADGGASISNGITLMLTSPVKSPEELSQDLWEKKFKKAATQCTGDRGAIIVFEWESLEDPTIFRDSNIFQSMAASTFTEYPYVSRIVMRCDNPPDVVNGLIHFDSRVYTVENLQPRFPDVTRFMRIEAPL